MGGDWDRFCKGGLEYHCCDDGGYGELISYGGGRANEEGVVGGTRYKRLWKG